MRDVQQMQVCTFTVQDIPLVTIRWAVCVYQNEIKISYMVWRKITNAHPIDRSIYSVFLKKSSSVSFNVVSGVAIYDNAPAIGNGLSTREVVPL